MKYLLTIKFQLNWKYFMKYLLTIKFQLNWKYFMKYLVKKIFCFQELKILFTETLFQKKPFHSSLILFSFHCVIEKKLFLKKENES